MQTVVGLFDSRAEAEAAIHRLRAIGVSPDAISFAMKDPRGDSAAAVSGPEPTLAEATGANDLAGEGTAVGAVSGAAVGTLVGLLVAGSTFVLPGVGTFLIAGPLASALAGAGVGAASGGLLGALIGSGIPEPEAQAFATDLQSGRVIVAARVDDALATEARRVFDEEGSRRTHSV
jgi:hypothetical protein